MSLAQDMRPATQHLLDKINATAGEHGKVSYQGSVPFGARLKIERFRLSNGLHILLVKDPTAPVIAYHTWFRVGSRCEAPGKTGISHLFEHLMFNEIEGLKTGEFDKKMEAIGADNNASTWLDFTQYQEAFPKKHLPLVIDLEARRMHQLVLREPQVLSEKDVVMNERRFRVEDDIEGTAEEQLWKTAFERHPYHWPTLGWMKDIEGLTTDDCREFYQRYYAPNNASLVIVGDLNEQKALRLISETYGKLAPSVLPLEEIEPEEPQMEERHVELNLPTETEKLFLGFKSPAVGDANHVVASLLIEVLCGGPASRLRRRLVRHDQIASDVGGFIGPHRDPSLMEISVAARRGVRAETLRAAIDEELTRIQQEAITEAELNRAKARMELGLLGGLESADGKASTIGFYQTLLGRPAAAFERMEELERLTPSDLLRVARSILHPRGCTSVVVRKNTETPPASESLS